ncbi:MAG: hypothetical protein IJS15_08650 [Victivallales bacterium]|nr:hypothetical protein [Victivallales bacterium]
MKRITALFAVMSFATLAVTLEETPDALTVQSSHYSIRFAKSDGYVGRFLSIGKSKVGYTSVTPILFQDTEPDYFERHYIPDATLVPRKPSAVTAQVVRNTPEAIELRFSYAFQGGQVAETLAFDESPAVLYTIDVAHSVRLHEQQFHVVLTNGGPDGVFLPDGERVTGVYNGNGELAAGPGWRVAWYAKKGMAVGVAAQPHPNLDGIEYAMQGPDGSWGNEVATLRVVHNPLARSGKNGNLQFRYALLAGGNPDILRKTAETLVGAPQGIRFFSCHLQKVATRPGTPNAMQVDVRNHSANPFSGALRLTLTHGLDSQFTLPATPLTLKPGETRRLEMPVSFPPDVRLGVAARCDLLSSDGKTIDTATDFCSVTDFAPRDAAFGIINVQQAHQDGSEHAWNRIFRKKYVGAYEFYCWAPSTIFGLAPTEEKWIPHTEANYTCTVTKKFLQTLVTDARNQGVGVYAWITGLWNYRIGIQHPELLQYTATGQPNIYNGTVWKNGHRRMVLKPNMFTPERTRMWAEEMADSVDMFGWDGCRWDWSFIPEGSSDPLYMGEHTDDWYDWKGVQQSKLYPEPDKTAEECLLAWRETVAKRHPDFVFGTNYGSGPEAWKAYPRWHALAATRSMVLFEDMLNYAGRERNTFGTWGAELAIRCDKVREHGGAPVVGAMRGLTASSVSSHLAHYPAAAAGVKWWCYGGSIHNYDRDKERNGYLLRFAEWYYGTEFLRPDSLSVNLTGSDKVLYEPFMRERKATEGREIVVPMLNLPEESDYVCQFHEFPPPRSSLVLQVPNTTVEVWIMAPQSSEKAQRLAVTDGKVSLPPLIDTALLLVRTQNEGGAK